MSAGDCGVKAAEMDGKADECFSADAADLYRLLASEWRTLRAEALVIEASARTNSP